MTEIDPAARARLGESNIPETSWENCTRWVATGCEDNGIQPVVFDAYSLGQVYKRPDGAQLGSDLHVLTILRGFGLFWVREAGMFKKKIEMNMIDFAESGVRFQPVDVPTSSSWGSLDLQGRSPGGQPLLRIGWNWSGSTKFTEMLRERERIAALLPT